MSKQQRIDMAKLKRAYARHFNVLPDHIAEHVFPDGDGEVWAKNEPELPRWSLGTSGGLGPAEAAGANKERWR